MFGYELTPLSPTDPRMSTLEHVWLSEDSVYKPPVLQPQVINIHGQQCQVKKTNFRVPSSSLPTASVGPLDTVPNQHAHILPVRTLVSACRGSLLFSPVLTNASSREERLTAHFFPPSEVDLLHRSCGLSALTEPYGMMTVPRTGPPRRLPQFIAPTTRSRTNLSSLFP
jgi:hypothetical protein